MTAKQKTARKKTRTPQKKRTRKPVPKIPRTLGERLRWAMKHRKKKIISVSKAVGCAPQTIQMILSGESNKSVYLYEITREVGVSYEWVVDGVGEPFREPGEVTRKIPILSEQEIANDYPDCLDKPVVNGISFDVEEGGDANRRLFACRLWDESLAPMFRPGGVLVFDPGRKPRPGNIVIARRGDEAWIRRYRETGVNEGYLEIELSPTNPDYYPVMLTHRQPGEIIGPAIHFRCDL